MATKPKLEHSYKVGDIVYLKSGSPKMTVTYSAMSHNNSYVEVFYSFYDKTDDYERFFSGSFNQECLTVADPNITA